MIAIRPIMLSDSEYWAIKKVQSDKTSMLEMRTLRWMISFMNWMLMHEWI